MPFNLKSVLRPESSIMVGLLTAGGVYLIYNNSVPNFTDLSMAPMHDVDVERQRKFAAIKSAALIGAVFLIARDLNSYIISGVALVGIDHMVKMANATDPSTKKLDASLTTGQSVSATAEGYPLPDYSEAGS